MALYRLRSGVLYETSGRAPAGSVPVDARGRKRRASSSKKRVDPAQSSDPVGTGVLVDQKTTQTEQLADGPSPATTAGEDLDSDHGIVGHED